MTNPVIDKIVCMLADKSKSGRIRSNRGIIALKENNPKAAETKSSLFTFVRWYATSDRANKKAANIPVAKSSDSGRIYFSSPPSLAF